MTVIFFYKSLVIRNEDFLYFYRHTYTILTKCFAAHLFHIKECNKDLVLDSFLSYKCNRSIFIKVCANIKNDPPFITFIMVKYSSLRRVSVLYFCKYLITSWKSSFKTEIPTYYIIETHNVFNRFVKTKHITKTCFEMAIWNVDILNVLCIYSSCRLPIVLNVEKQSCLDTLCLAVWLSEK
jgi:hypothetical protein